MYRNQVIGIDLGTTNSLCAVFREGKPELVPNAVGEFLTPSVVGVLDDGQIVVGNAAAEFRVTSPERTVSCFKRWIGTGHEVKLADHRFNSSELSSFVLRALREDAEKFLGHPIHDAVITVPAYFNDKQRKDTQLAGKLAGLNVRRIINEPTAAALTYGFHDRQAEKTLIVIDLGGGTFDVTVMQVFEGTLEIVATAGESQLGGEDFTTRLVAWTLRKRDLQLEPTEVKYPLFVSRLKHECEVAKCRLASQSTADIRIPSLNGLFSDKPDLVQLSRNDTAEIFAPLLARLTQPISRAIRDSRLAVGDIDEVILVGGATRCSEVRNCVAEMFRTKPHSEFDPDQVVALGASIQAALIENDEAVEDMVMTDVCPFTLGVEVVKDVGRRQVGGYYCPVISRNTTIPVSREEILSTISPNQRIVQLKVYQGESRKVENNLLLGELNVEGIPPGPAGKEVHVRFTYDVNGILEVEAYVPETGKKSTIVLTNHSKGLSQREIDQAVKRMQEIKFYPREDVANQRILKFAERVVGEVSPFQRSSLEGAIDQYEGALEMGDRQLFFDARDHLLLVLSQLGFNLQRMDDEL